MPAPLSLAADDASVVEDYLAARRAAGRKTGRSTTRAAHTCQAKIDRAGGWAGLTAEQQIYAVAKAPSFTSWLMVTGRITVDAELLSRTDSAARTAGTVVLRRRTTIGSAKPAPASVFPVRDTAAQWNILAKITAITGVPPRADHRRTFRRRPRRDDHRLRPPRQAHRGQKRGRGLSPLAADALPRRSDLHAAPANGETPGFGHRMGNHRTGIRRDRAAIPRDRSRSVCGQTR